MTEQRAFELFRRLDVVIDWWREGWSTVDTYDMPYQLARVRDLCRHGRLGCLRDVNDRISRCDLTWRGKKATKRILDRLETGVSIAVMGKR